MARFATELTSGRYPELLPLAAMTPTLFDELRKCQLRTAYRLDRSFSSFRRPTLVSALGETSHELAERAGRGEFDETPPERLRTALEEAWDTAVQLRYRGLREVWTLAPVPPPERWPGYQRTRVRLIRSLSNAIGRRAIARQTAEDNAAVRQVHIETWLEPSDLPLRGRPDRIEVTENGVHIIDLKSSWTYGDEIRDEHRAQLLLYCAIWERLTGELPRMASIQTADGTRLSFAVTSADVSACVAEALSALDGYNAAVNRRAPPSELASPSPGTCRYCVYRGCCMPFFGVLSAAWEWWPRTLHGTLTGKSDGAATSSLVIAVTASNLDNAPAEARVRGVPSPLTPALGTTLSIVDACPTISAAEVSVTWNTQLVAYG